MGLATKRYVDEAIRASFKAHHEETLPHKAAFHHMRISDLEHKFHALLDTLKMAVKSQNKIVVERVQPKRKRPTKKRDY